jgi:membrane-bound serine protease (ClpP class)
VMMVIVAIVKTRRMPAAIGTLAMVGNKAIARTTLDPEGFVFVEGARWKAIAASEDAPIITGESVVITGVKGLTLNVARRRAAPVVDETPPTPAPTQSPARERYPPAIADS